MFPIIIDYWQTVTAIPYFKEAFLVFLFFVLLLIRLSRKSRTRSEAPAESEDTGEKRPQPQETDTESEADTEPVPAPRSSSQAEPIRATGHEPAIASPEVKTKPVIPEPVGLMERLKNGLNKTRRSLTGRLETAFSEKQAVDADVLEEIEEILITSDVGVRTAMELIRRLEQQASAITDMADLKRILKAEMLEFMAVGPPRPAISKPHVIMVVGVNGVGKTTTIGKLAARYRAEGKSVLLGAADTFRAAAVEQLGIWADRTGVEIVRHRDKADPAAVAYDSIEAAISRDIDVVIIDTAGRLHTKVNLMEQLKKIKRSIDKRLPGAPHEVLLVVDATTGQNAVSQAKQFNEGIGVTSVALTKLDGTAKGGIVIGICNELKLPLTYIGVGEKIEDLQPFDPKSFIEALF